MDFNFALFVMVTFWVAMVYINAKVMIEINKEWSIENQRAETMKLKNEKDS